MEKQSITQKVDLPIRKIWEALRDFEHYLPLVSGYSGHQWIKRNEFLLQAERPNSLFMKNIAVKISFKEWKAPKHIRVAFKDVNDKFHGVAMLETRAIHAQQTLLTLHVQYSLSGAFSKFFAGMIKANKEEILVEIKKFIETYVSKGRK